MNDFTHNGKTFKVRPIEGHEAWKISHHRNDADWQVLQDPNIYSADHTQKWIENMPASSKRLLVEETKEPPKPLIYPKHVGVIRIDHIDQTNKTCFVGADIHGEYKGTGLARPIYTWLFWYLFDNLNMNALYLEVLETNTLAVKLYEKLGFKQTGIWPERVFRDGIYVNALLFSLLRSDYKSQGV